MSEQKPDKKFFDNIRKEQQDKTKKELERKEQAEKSLAELAGNDSLLNRLKGQK